MKKLSLILACLLLLAGLPALAEQQSEAVLTVKEDTFVVYDSYANQRIYYAAILENTGGGPARVDTMELKFLDADGKEVARDSLSGMTPYYLMPGELGYAYTSYIDVDEGGVPVSHTVDLKAAVTYMGDELLVWLPTESEYKLMFNDGYNSGFSGSLMAEVENNTEVPQFDEQMSFILRDKEGKHVYIGDGMAYNVGIPVGAKILARKSLDTEILLPLIEQKRDPATMETLVYVTQD